MNTFMNITLKIIKDYPKPGVNFLDINPLLQEPKQFAYVIDELARWAQQTKTDISKTAIIVPEARGFIFGAPVAYKLGLPLLLIRKKGKIPNNPYSFHITNEYSSYDMEIDGDLLEKYDKFIYIDDILATGQTLASVRQALKNKGKEMVLSLHVADVPALKSLRDGNAQLKDLTIKVVLKS